MSAQIYTPYICNITQIVSNGKLTTITTDIINAFVIGNLVGFSIPKEYGMRQLNALKGSVLDVTDYTVTVTIDTSYFDPFVIPTVPTNVVVDPAQILPVGDYNSGYVAPGGVQPEYLTIPGAFKGVVI